MCVFVCVFQHIAVVTHYLIYKLLYAVLSVFQEDTLGNPAVSRPLPY